MARRIRMTDRPSSHTPAAVKIKRTGVHELESDIRKTCMALAGGDPTRVEVINPREARVH